MPIAITLSLAACAALLIFMADPASVNRDEPAANAAPPPGRSDETRAFFEAIIAGQDPAALELLRAHAELAGARTEDGVSALLLSMYFGRSAIAEAIRGQLRELDIFEAAASGDTARVCALLRDDPVAAVSARSPDGFTPLHLAAFFGKSQAMRILIAHGADVDLRATNRDQVAPIHSAAASRNARLVQILLAAGADPDARQRGGFTPLHAAAQHGNRIMIQLLLNAGADAMVAADDGRTAVEFVPEDRDECRRLLAQATP